MFLRELTASVDHIRGAGPAVLRALARGGVVSIGGLLCRYPRDWEDRSRIVPLRDYYRFPAVCTVVRVLAHDWFGFGRMKTLKVHVEDETGRGVLICFNRSFLEKQLIVGRYYRLWGRFFYKYGEIQSTAFEVEALQDAPGEGGGDLADRRRMPGDGFARILPVYPLSAGLNQGMLRRLIRQALEQYGGSLENELPEEIIRREGFLPKSEALRAIHFPASLEELEKARKALIFEELFYLEVMVGKRALERRRGIKKSPPRGEKRAEGEHGFSPLQRRLLERLPFSLTPGQTKAVIEINQDMDGSQEGISAPMARLLQGDVGSGKTLVSVLAALKAVEEGGQAAILAPTELLARQHAENAARLLEPVGIRPAFLTGNIKAAGRKELLKRLAAGEIDLAVGTHALFSRDVVYRNLRLVVVDEQHRFGVTQRSLIMAKGQNPGFSPGVPDLLMMSATPIPRTLALTVFGDMDVSVIRDLPPGRKPVKTHLARESNEGKVYDFVRRELAAGHQAYFVYPLIGLDGAGEDNSKNLKDAASMAERLGRQIFPEYAAALIHSKLDEEEKRKTMEAFRKGDIRILAATSVVEVGVDVPNATCMVIEHAERFGLSALHQLRGRVGRGDAQSYCFLVYSDPAPDQEAGQGGAPIPGGQGAGLTEDGKIRLKVMLENSDGFVIAEEDLKLRGPGQIAGIEQSGYLTLGIADPIRDALLLEQARIDAFAMLEKDPGLLSAEYLRVAQVLSRAPPFSDVVW
ncbi:MAG: ATP-dependent DNA helicase RecG [Treponema sp.]|nr:ATP-dependent DNA helicase RecG [Treponema sp.]